MRLSFISAEQAERYVVRHKLEILHILRAIIHQREILTVYFGTGDHFLITSLLAIDEHGGNLILGYGADESSCQRLLRSPNIDCSSTQDGVKVLFSAASVRKTSHEGQAAFAVPIPATLLKMQRREYYRMMTPMLNPLKCQIQGPNGPVETNVVDISVGGLGVLAHPQGIDLVVGQVYPGCRIDVREGGPVIASIAIRSHFLVTLKNGHTSHRVGCQFIDLPASEEARLQKYILDKQRELKARPG
jgi:c-di-GMP-binding flagellar brake protein YcgR